MRFRLTLAASLLAASCAPTTRPVAPPPVPRAVAPPPAPVPLAADWRDWPVTPGRWTYTRDSAGPLATYGLAGAGAAAVLRCDLAGRRLFLSRAGGTPAPITVRTSSIARVLQAGATGGEPPYVAVMLAANDPLLDAMAFSRGRFALEQAGKPPLVLPAWAEVSRVIEDCRG